MYKCTDTVKICDEDYKQNDRQTDPWTDKSEGVAYSILNLKLKC